MTAPPGTALQIAQMLAAGKIDTTQAGKLSKAGNISTLQVAHALNVLRAAGERQEPDVRSPEVKQLDAHFPAAKPEDYLIRYGEPGQEMLKTPELKQFDTTARAWLSGAGLSRELGNSLVNTIAKAAQTTKDMTPDQLDSYGYTEFAKLQAAYGDTLNERLREAGRMVEVLELKQPGLKNLLLSNGVGDCALVASTLIQQSQRYWPRRR